MLLVCLLVICSSRTIRVLLRLISSISNLKRDLVTLTLRQGNGCTCDGSTLFLYRQNGRQDHAYSYSTSRADDCRGRSYKAIRGLLGSLVL